MGMAASQVRFLQLTSRKADIGRELQHLSLQKMDLSRDMQLISRNYQNSLSAKTMKWSNNAGVTCTDISYSTLMHPNPSNAKTPILITNTAGKIVLDDKYKQYAEMLDAAGGKWDGDVRNKILASLTGISEGDIDTANTTAKAAEESLSARTKASAELDKWKDKEESNGGTKYLTVDGMSKYLGSVNGKDLSSLYKQAGNGDYKITSAGDLESLVNGIQNNMSKYFVDDDLLGVTDKTEFEKACKTISDTYKGIIEATGDNADKSRELMGLKGSNGNWTIDIKFLFGQIMGAYITGEGSYDYNSSDEKVIPLRDTTSSAWQNWYQGLKERQEALDAATDAYDKDSDAANQVMTADQETQLAYYDRLFQAIADNGWVYDGGVLEQDYVNQMFQNNEFLITTISDEDKDGQFEYDTNVASNFYSIVTVNDSDARNEAQVEYEYQKSIINQKESRIDTRMKNLETEESAIKEMLESINQIKEDNIERNYGLWA